MSKFNNALARVVRGPIRSQRTPSGATYEGAPGYARDAGGRPPAGRAGSAAGGTRQSRHVPWRVALRA
jgi:hypothetical protein